MLVKEGQLINKMTHCSMDIMKISPFKKKKKKSMLVGKCEFANENIMSRCVTALLLLCWLQIYQEDMMRSLLQNSLHVFRAISGNITDLG